MRKPPTKPIKSSAPAREYLRVQEATAFCGIPKPTLYNMIRKNLIRSVALREPGSPRGTRLIHFQSLKDFLEARTVG